MTSILFYLTSITYKIENNTPIIYLFGRTKEGKRLIVKDSTFQPYFYVLVKNEEILEKIKNLEIDEGKVLNVEKIQKNYLEKEITAYKIIVNLPSSIPKFKDELKNWENIERVLEYDLSFTRRYLIDKKITPMTLLKVEESTAEKAKVTVINAKIVEEDNEELMPNTKILALDIETYNPDGKQINPDKNPIIMLALKGENYEKVLTWKKIRGKNIEILNSEAELLQKFKELIETEKPDILTGYYSDGFDLPYIKSRANKYRIKIDIGWDDSELNIKGRTEKIAEINGIIHVDILKFVRRIMRTSLKTDTYTLDNVAQEILGEHKHDVPLDLLAQTWDVEDETQLKMFADYNLHDANLCYQLCKKLLPNMLELVKIISLPLFDVQRMSFSQLVEWYTIKQAQLFNELIPNKPGYYTQQERNKKRLHGAFVYEPTPGLYQNLVVFDYRSLYPSIISSHNISIGTVNCETCKNKEKVPTEYAELSICQDKKGFLSTIIKSLIEKRARIKIAIKKKPTQLLKARSEALKLLSNSFYGYLAFPLARWYCFEGAEATTAWARFYVKNVIEQAKETGFKVLYSDSLPYDRRIIVRTPQKDIKIKKIGDLYNEFSKGYTTLAYTNKGKVKFNLINRVIKHKLKKRKKLLKIITKYGSTIVTDEHSIYVYKNKIELTRAAEIKKGDYLISLTNPSLEVKYKKNHVFDIANMDLGEYKNKLVLYNDKKIFPAKKGKCPYCNKQVLLSAHVNSQHKDRKQKINKNSNFKFVGTINAVGEKIPRYWQLDADLAWLLGFYAAKGSISESKTKTGIKHSLSFGSQNVKLIKKVKFILDKKIDARLRIIKNFDKRNKKYMYYYRVQGVPIIVLFKNCFDAGKGSEFKKVPFFILNSEEKLRRAFLKGYLDGDGTQKTDKRYKTHFMRFSTKSKELAIGLQFLIKTLTHGNTFFGKKIQHVSWQYRKDKPKINSLRLQSAKKSKKNFCLSEVKEIKKVPHEKYVYDLEVKGCHNFVDAEGLLLVHNTDSVFLLLENKTKKDAVNFCKEINKNLSEQMELELQGYYHTGLFVGVKRSKMGAKKKYALLDENNKIIVKGFETVRRNWSFIAKEVQKEVLNIILKEKNKNKAFAYVKDIVEKLKKNEVDVSRLIISTQLQKPIEEYENVSPHVAAAKLLEKKGKPVIPGMLLKFIICKGEGRIRDKVKLPEDVKKEDYDGEYYIHHQIIPAVESIFNVLSLNIEKQLDERDQTTLGQF